MSCLFRSLGSLVGKDADALRNDICDFLDRNPRLIDDVDAKAVVEWESGMPIHDYVRRMRQRSTWGGGIEIAAFVNMTGHPVVVQDLRTQRHIAFHPPNPSRTARTLHISWNGCHYEPES
jgi:hypothetical protein